MIRIRDPIHGSIRVSADELAIIDHPVFQRLRGIKQLGFTDQAFPGATHTRYAHSIGAMEVASRMFDAAFPIERSDLPPPERHRFRQLVRLALLLHDIGHPPASHASEAAMPRRAALGLACFSPAELNAQARHEDFTVKLLLDSELGGVLSKRFGDAGIDCRDVAHLISERFPDRAATFMVGGIDYFPVLTQMVSGEMDADRMDYLQRDSFFAGVNYGKFDQSWLLENLAYHVVDGRALLALTHRAVFAFEDFLLSRYHMFVSVYYHYIPVGFDTMLLRFFAEAPGDFALPSDADDYARVDDVTLWSALRTSPNRWARRIAYRQAFRRVFELNGTPAAPDLAPLEAALDEAGIEWFTSRDVGVLSKYYRGNSPSNPIYVVDHTLGRAVPVDEYTQIFERYAQPARLVRVYVRPDQTERARHVVDAFRDKVH